MLAHAGDEDEQLRLALAMSMQESSPPQGPSQPSALLMATTAPTRILDTVNSTDIAAYAAAEAADNGIASALAAEEEDEDEEGAIEEGSGGRSLRRAQAWVRTVSPRWRRRRRPTCGEPKPF